MKLYYLEHDLYPATYNFKDEADGTSGTDITGIDYEESNDSTYSAVIVAVEDGHRKVIQFDAAGDNGKESFWRRNFDDQTGISNIELLVKYIDNGVGSYDFRILDSGANIAVLLRINCTDNKLYAYHAGINSSVAIAPDTWIHIRIQTNTTTDHQWVWVNGTVLISDVAFWNSMTLTEIAYLDIFLINGAGANTLKIFIDAIGEDWDSNYNIADNREVDWHVYNKEEITNIVEYPSINHRLNNYTLCQTTINTFEGALFDDWYARDFNKILIEDNSDNIIFRGYLTGKVFTKDSLILYFAGIGIMLDWKHFGDQGNINYILASGLVDIPIPATSIITLKKDNNDPMGWDPDWWIVEGKDVGLLIVDKTDVNERTWDSSAISQTGGTIKQGNNTSTTTFNDDDYIIVRQQSGYNFNTVVTPVIDGIVIADTDFLKHIEIQYSFRLRIYTVLAEISATIYFEILKDTEWLPIAQVSASRFNGGHTTKWVMGIPTVDYEGSTGNPKVYEDTDTELRKFFNKDNGNYSELKGLRFKIVGTRGTTEIPYGDIQVDFINVKVGYDTYDISPIMEKIHNNAASTVTCLGVSAWDETGVVEDDVFKIGQNTKVILQDIGSESNIEVITLSDAGTAILRPNADGIHKQWDHTDSGGDGSHYKDLDEIVLDPNAGDGNCISTQVDAENDSFNMETTTIGEGRVVTNISLYCYGKRSELLATARVYFKIATTGWLSARFPISEFDNAYHWDSVSWGGLNLSQTDLDSLQIKFLSTTNGAAWVYVDSFYIEITYDYIILEKYMAREFKGNYCMEPLKAICKLEGVVWYEDYINNQIIVVKESGLVDSAVDLTEADYKDDWEYEDDCNQVREFFVFGKSEDLIFAKAIDETVDGYISKQLIDESITNVADAQDIADVQLALLNSKRPSIKLPLGTDNSALQLGTTVDVTFARPTIAKAAYPIRKINRSLRGVDEIQTVLYIGMGESTVLEKIAKDIRDNAFRSHKSLTDRLISP